MKSRRSKTFPIILTLLILAIIVYIFTNIKQSEVVCEKRKVFDDDIVLKEELTTTIDSKNITHMKLVKTIVLPPKYLNGTTYLNSIKYALENTLEYLGDSVDYDILKDRIVVTIDVDDDEILLLDNIDFVVNDDIEIKINSNTKSSDVMTLSVGDNYTDGELMKRFKNNGYSCK